MRAAFTCEPIVRPELKWRDCLRPVPEAAYPPDITRRTNKERMSSIPTLEKGVRACEWSALAQPEDLVRIST